MTSTFDLAAEWTGEPSWIPDRTMYLTVHGSRAYGTDTSASDTDIRGICVAPAQYYIGVGAGFKQVSRSAPTDLTIFEIRAFAELALAANPNALELLFTDPESWITVRYPIHLLLDIRDAFLSTRIRHTFAGYAKSQMKRIHNHYRWIKNPPAGPPTRSSFGLPERLTVSPVQVQAAETRVQHAVSANGWTTIEHLDPATRQAVRDEFFHRLLELTKWTPETVDTETNTAAARSLGYGSNFIELLNQERAYKAAVREWDDYQNWVKNRNPARAALEAMHGYDTKHAMHAVRLARTCRDALVTGELRVRRPDAAELLEIRNGAMIYEELVQFVDAMDSELSALVPESPLPRSPDRSLVTSTVEQIVFTQLERDRDLL